MHDALNRALKRSLVWLLLSAAAAMLGACASLQPGAPAADLVLLHGKIVTVDDRFSLAQALAIRGERIVAVGSDAEVRTLAGPTTRVVDLGGRTVIPGLIDGHLHNAGGGPGVNLAEVRSMADLLAAVEREAKLAHPGELIVSNADWHEAQLK